MMRKVLSVTVGLTVGLALLAAPATARPTVSKMRFKLDAHEVPVGADVTGPVHLWTRSDHRWVPLAGAELVVSVDGVDIGSVTTDGDGLASVVYTATVEGDHVMRVSFAGDDAHRKARRSQGFTVTTAPAS